jgi:hypothetical protein
MCCSRDGAAPSLRGRAQTAKHRESQPVNVMTGADQARPTFGFPFVEQFPRVNRID